MKIAILVPTLGRADALIPLAENVAATTPRDVYSLIFVCDHGDRDSQAAALAAPGARMLATSGAYPVKANAGFVASNDDLVAPTADDVWFRAGWYERVVRAFADPDVHVVGTNDTTPTTSRGDHATMPVIRRSYCEDPGAAWGEPGSMFHAGYHHNYVETETCQLAQARGVWRFEPLAVIEHRHPDWGTRPLDETDRIGNRRNVGADRALFERRAAEWATSK